MSTSGFDLFDREKRLLEEGPSVFEQGSVTQLRDFSERLFERFRGVVRENEDLTKHSDRQERRLVKLNQNLKAQTKELDERKVALETLSRQLAKYLPPQIHEALFAGRYDTEVRTQRKRLTVFFSDIKDFTQTAESLQPETLTEYLNEYFSEMTRIALSFGATIDKYIGDAMMVFFGDPESRGEREDARACLSMALAMQDRLRELHAIWTSRGFQQPFVVRMGINTGYCNVGNFGSSERLSYTIVGGEVNVAARLESNADPGGLLISYETYALVRDLVDVEERQSVRMKGIARDIRTFAVLKRSKNSQDNDTVRLSDPAGVDISIDKSDLSAERKAELAVKLRHLAQQLEC
jgi:class 3 adenylate cyclase